MARMPSAQYSERRHAVAADRVVARAAVVARCRPRSPTRRSGSRARSARRRPTRPVSSMRSTPLPSVSTRWHVRLVVGLQVLVVEARPLAELAVPRLQRLGGRRVLDDGVDAGPDLVHLLVVAVLEGLRRYGSGVELVTRRPCRRRSGRGCAGRCRSSRPSRGPRRRSRRSAAWRSSAATRFCQPGSSVANHSGSIGWLLRTSIDDGVRWNTYSSCASRASGGMHCTAVAPVPMMPTRLSARFVIGAPVGSRRRCRRSPSGWCGSSGPAKVSMPGMPGSLGRCSGPVPMATNAPGSRRRGRCG